MISENQELIKYDEQFIRAIQQCNLEHLKDLLSSNIRKPDIEIPDQKISMLTGYKVYYKRLANSEVETINTNIAIIVYLGKYIGCQTPDFIQIVKDYDSDLAFKAYRCDR